MYRFKLQRTALSVFGLLVVCCSVPSRSEPSVSASTPPAVSLPTIGPAVVTGVSDGAGGMIVALVDPSHGLATIRLQLANPAGTPLWASQGVLITKSGNTAVDPVMAEDGAGGAVVAWLDMASGISTLVAQRVSAAGVTQWNPGGVPLSTTVDTWLPGPAIVAVFGGAIVAWVDRSGFYPRDIKAQRIDGSGVIRWATGGVNVCAAVGDQTEPVMLPSGNTGTIIVWTDTRSGPSRDLYAQRLNGNGVPQWPSDGVDVSVDAFDQETPSMVADGADGALILWSDDRYGTNDLFAQHLNLEGNVLWGSPKSVCTAAGDQRRQQAVSDSTGGAIVAWEDSRNGSLDIYAQRVLASGDTAWTPTVPVCVAGGNQATVLLAADEGAGAVIAWLDSRASFSPELYAQRINASGMPQWAANGIAVCPVATAFEHPVIVADGNGGALLTWEEYRTFDRETYGQHVDGAGVKRWAAEGAGILLNPGIQRLPVQVSDGNGGSIVAWQQKIGGTYKVFVRRYAATGVPAWPAMAVSTASGFQGLPSIAADADGGAIVAWVDGRPEAGIPNVYVQRVSAAGDRLWPEGGVALCTAPGLQLSRAMVADGSGGAIVVWTDSRDPADPDIYVQRVNDLGVPQWTNDGVVLCGAAGAQEFSSDFGHDVLTADGAGGAIVSWTDWRSGSGADVYAQRVDSNGVPLWTLDGVGVCAAVGNQLFANLAIDGDGGAIFMWEDWRSPTTGIYTQRLSAAGISQWTPDGVLVSGTSYSGFTPQVVSDGAGGAIVAWAGFGSPSTAPDIFTQRVSASGVRLWSPRDGRAVCLASGIQREPALASDGAGGAIIGWLDLRGGESLTQADLYAQRVLANGTMAWSYNGVPLCAFPDLQGDLTMITDGSRGTIAAWQDSRSAGGDFVYLQRLDSRGLSLWDDLPVTGVTSRDGQTLTASFISSISPNPAREGFVVSFSVPSQDPAILDVFDVKGRRLLSQPLFTLEAGTHSLRLEMPENTAAGIYLVRLVQSGQSVSKKICVLR